MTTWKLTIAYEGTKYHGWQRQQNTEQTVQGKIEAVLSRLAGHHIEIHGAGRTDRGVHARAQIASFAMQQNCTAQELQTYLNTYLPQDIAVQKVEIAPARFHARLCAQGKRYRYRLWTAPYPPVFERATTCIYPGAPLDLERVRCALPHLCGTHDFRVFSSLKRSKKSTVRTLSSIQIETHPEEIHFVLEGDGFLYNMVRILVGTLIAVGCRKLEASALPTLFEAPARPLCIQTMPACGLTLEEVFYP